MSRLGSGYDGWSNDDSGREYGSRRQKVMGYLKAANDLRQTYTAQISQKWQDSYGDTSVDAPGAFPDVDIARSGDEEMVIFPSYARRHVKRNRSVGTQPQPMPGTHEDINRPNSPGSMEYWKKEWEKYEDDNAIVDIDIRGWLYNPQRGPLNRKHRLLIALARKLSGIPAPSTIPSNSIQQRVERREDEDVSREAQSIINKGEHDADSAWRNNRSGENSDSDAPGRISRASTTSSLNKDDLSIANARLMERLRPFMNSPMVGGAITLFFFNDEESQSRTTLTDDSGHFNIRTALEFVPTHVRILASESLSVTEEIRVIKPTGVSLISDIDDTIKHSAISSGAKEIFRNTFVRELDELTVEGVREWYNKLAEMGVNIHYVSNSPWQIYPLLKSYFKLAGLPPGSFHLKQYSGMLQGIFEPTAERKRASLEKIMRDFPERRFILVGDSGEADLEVYTEVVQEYPGRVLGVFIRDVTTTEKKDFFDRSFDQTRPSYRRTASSSPVIKDQSDSIRNRPILPPRNVSGAKSTNNEDLINFDDTSSENEAPDNTTAKQPPTKPSKPSALRTASTLPISTSEQKSETIRRKPAPPLPGKPRGLSVSQKDPVKENSSKVPPLPQRKPTFENDAYTNTVKNAALHAYNNLPSTKDTIDTLSRFSLKETAAASQESTSSKRGTPPPPPPPRRAANSTPSNNSNNNEKRNAADTPPKLPSRQNTPLSSSLTPSASNTRLNSNQNQDYESGLAYYDPVDGPPQLNKREELWKRRWERAQHILSDHGVVLGSWRVGNDAQDITTWLVEDALKKMEKQVGHDEKT
ncbi:putative actin cytoskeleton organization protein App1 [Talaromyces proteolyticus]|uniref:Actin cytoskeleton organization protein App1 n=1 Tax=Talaromyces proteolyticus TaxID=1131652 RepID=A0AAD4KII4_9EURO|nr:putative actin cytoskeleton organization protein App1 [Talaromyces proteolyticus]KAH8692311.1 putative actin cytoskeleton organization protein App1 [Talaromyces proteolyticus]